MFASQVFSTINRRKMENTTQVTYYLCWTLPLFTLSVILNLPFVRRISSKCKVKDCFQNVKGRTMTTFSLFCCRLPTRTTDHLPSSVVECCDRAVHAHTKQMLSSMGVRIPTRANYLFQIEMADVNSGRSVICGRLARRPCPTVWETSADYK